MNAEKKVCQPKIKMLSCNRMNTITISKNKITKDRGVVILPIEEYRKLTEQAAPTYYLTGKLARDLGTLVEQGLKEHWDGKTVKAKSLREALHKYERSGKH